MPFFTSFSLALKHLRKKKLHTLLSVFSNCIGMVALGLVISLTFGITTFIAQQESSMLSAYPITISRLAYNSPLFSSKKEDKVQIPGRVYVDEAVENITSLKQLNNLSPTYIKEVIDKINPLDVLEIKYDYGSQLNVYKEVNAVISMYVGINATANYDMTDYFSILGFGGGWLEVPKTEVLNQQYDVVYGTLPNSFDELVLVLDENNTISSAKLKLLGIGLDMDVMPQSYSYEQIASLAKFKLLSNDALFIEDGTKFKDIRRVERLGGMSFNLVDKSTYLNGVDLKVTAIVKAKEGNNLCALTTTAIGYLPELIDFVNGNTPSSIGFGKQSKIGQWMLNENTKFINPLTNVPYLDNNSNPLIGSKLDQMTTDSIIYGVGNYVNAIKIYPKTMKAKDNIFSLLNNWNDDIIRLEKDKVYYVDYISLLSTSLSSLISSISLILGIFSIISIISTLIMTATMFYNDVLERRKEIGILKALGMSSTSIGNNFVSESFIQGIIAGFIGIIITNYLAIQLGQYLHSKLKIIPVNVVMFNINIASLIFIMTVGIIMLSSIIPSLIASKTNAVTSLKSE
jgi:putative ABC transport system permease protein